MCRGHVVEHFSEITTQFKYATTWINIKIIILCEKAKQNKVCVV